jgi:hypothetical protein
LKLPRAEVESKCPGDFARVLPGPQGLPTAPGRSLSRVNLEEGQGKNGLAQLVLTLVQLLHELLERQGIKRIEAGSLTETEIERLGLTLMNQAREIARLREEFGLKEEDLNLDLGPLGRLR